MVVPPSRRVYDGFAMVMLAASPVLAVWLFGGMPFWAAGPLLFCCLLGAGLYGARPLFFGGKGADPWPPGFLPLLVFIAYGAAQLPRAIPFESAVEWLKVAGAVLAYGAWTGLSREGGRWRWLLALLLLTVTLMAWYAIIQHAQGSRLVLTVERPAGYGMRASGAYICPNHFANLLALTAPMALALAMMPAAGIPLRLLAGYAALVILPPLYLSGSRSAWLGLLAGLCVTAALLGLRRGARRAWLVLLATAVALAVSSVLVWWLSPLVQARVADALTGNVRLNLWRDTLAMIADKPWWGHGPGVFRWVYPRYWHHLNIYIDPEFAHNDYLQLVAEYGVVGAALLLTALGVALVRMVGQIGRADGARGDFLCAGFVGACAACAVHACFDYNFHVYGNVQTLAVYGGITAGMLGAHGRFVPPTLLSARWRFGVALLPFVLLVLLSRSLLSYGLALRGEVARLKQQPDAAVEAYRLAARVAPENGLAHRGIGLARSAQTFLNFDRELKQRQAEEAAQAFQRALQLNPQDLDARFGLAQLRINMGDPQGAVAELRALVDRAPYHREYLVALGLQLRAQQQYEEALALFERAKALGNTEQIQLNIDLLRRRLLPPSS